MITDKIGPHHLERKAILYIRQSSAHQALHNRESGALQYAMWDRLTALGFTEIEVIDEDLGRSAAGGVQRAGFERMAAATSWRRLQGQTQLPKIIGSVTFRNGIEVASEKKSAA